MDWKSPRRRSSQVFKSTWHHLPITRRVGDLLQGNELLAMVETFPNQFPNREYEIEITCPEFTAVCPKTGQPDFGTIVIEYVPATTCLELKSLKLYLFSFRDRGIFYEHVVNTILDDLVTSCQPKRMKVTGRFNARGGITSRVTAVHGTSTS